jgi:hypothetical protein
MTWTAPEDGWYVKDPDRLHGWRKLGDGKLHQAVRENRSVVLLTAGASPAAATVTTQVRCEQCGEVVTGDSPDELGAAMRQHDWRTHRLRTLGWYAVVALKAIWAGVYQALDELLTPS